MSLDVRMRWALRLAVGLSLFLALATLFIGGEIDRTSLSVRTATSDLRVQNTQEAALRDLRTAIGTATRRAERGGRMGPGEVARLADATDDLDSPVHQSGDAHPPRVAAELETARRHSGVFADSARDLLRAAQGPPAGIAERLPPYLRDLRALEDAQTRVRHELTREADLASFRNLDLIRRLQAALAGGGILLILTFAVLTHRVRRDVVAPVERLNRLLADAADCTTPDGRSHRPSEVGALADGVAALRCLLAEREDALARLRVISQTDALTELPNRLLFDQRLPEAIAAAARGGGEVGLVCIDVDRFKEINDARGHAGGDRVLRDVAGVLRAVCDGGETVSRIGGDEFAIIQAGASQPAAARGLVDRLMTAMAAHRLTGDPLVGISVGAAIYPRDGDNDQLLRHHADLALYRAKNAGRGRACFFGALEAAVAHDADAGASTLAADLPAAIPNGELTVAYQPKLHARTGAIAGAEALVRWNHPTRGQVQPDEFIEIAERTGQIRALTEWMLTRTIADQARLAAQGREIEFFVNISAPLLGDPDFAETLLRIAANRTGVIGLEITETAIIDDPQSTLAHLHRFVDAGLKIAIDDYGAGWSSLNYLKQLPAHELKIDRSFISDISRSHRDPLLVRSTIDLAHALGMEVTAEGVDTPAALALLKVMGCDVIQGFLISKPLGLDDLVAFLNDDARLAHLDRMPMGLGAGAGARVV